MGATWLEEGEIPPGTNSPTHALIISLVVNSYSAVLQAGSPGVGRWYLQEGTTNMPVVAPIRRADRTRLR